MAIAIVADNDVIQYYDTSKNYSYNVIILITQYKIIPKQCWATAPSDK